MKRRTFLATAGASAAAVLAGPWMRRSRAATFGAFPAGSEAVQLPAAAQAKRVLEIYLYGGLSAWETLYFVRRFGASDYPDPTLRNTQYWALAADNAQAIATCGASSVATMQPFGTDGAGESVELGPFATKLFARPDVTARMRIVVQRHNLEPHEAAVPQALTGRPVGQPTAAGLGAHIQRARLDANATPDRASPFSYVFATGGISSDNIAAAAASGTHPGSARPLLVKTDNATAFTQLLNRTTLGAGRDNHDALVGAYLDQYQSRLKWPSDGSRVRSPRTDDLAIAYATTKKSDAIHGVLTDQLFATKTGTSCHVTDVDIPRIGLTAARALLTHPTEPASYVCVSDIGLQEASGGGGYDTHTENARDTAKNFDNILDALFEIMNGPNETDPTKLSLDDTMIILNTEFGRTPITQGGTGRNHHPYGYVTAFIGGPITAAQKGVYGAIGPDGNAIEAPLDMDMMYATPLENRIAALLALGIWPFAADGFNVSDVPRAGGEVDAASRAMKKFLGRTA